MACSGVCVLVQEPLSWLIIIIIEHSGELEHLLCYAHTNAVSTVHRTPLPPHLSVHELQVSAHEHLDCEWIKDAPGLGVVVNSEVHHDLPLAAEVALSCR